MTKHSGQVGLEHLVYAILHEDGITYDPPKLLSPAIEAKITPKTNSETQYADDKPVETATTLGEIDVELQTQDAPLQARSDLLGHATDEKGILIESGKDNAPYVAIGFKSKKGDNSYRYVWLLKGKFQEIEEDYKTKEDKVSFATPTLKGTFVTRDDDNWKFTADENNGMNSDVKDKWFDAVYQPNVDTEPLTATTTPENGATGVAAGSNVSFVFNKAVNQYTVNDSSVFLLKADGTTIDSTIVISTDSKTVSLAPKNALEAGNYMAIATKAIKSDNGATLANNIVVDFTV
ncbi:major tail protein [Clostridium tyrobutyricum]|uniref:major tail protein n=1 Tax=Clostridium tyrobutyricum TaxID=1519 RepID=UPI00068EF42F|nr:major tail protein [Clostridium tyrobutyricum]